MSAIALYIADSPLHCVDTAVLCNNKGAHSVDMMWWVLAQEVLCTPGSISCEHPCKSMPDLGFYGDLEEKEKEEQATDEKAMTKEEFPSEQTAPTPKFTATQSKLAG